MRKTRNLEEDLIDILSILLKDSRNVLSVSEIEAEALSANWLDAGGELKIRCHKTLWEQIRASMARGDVIEWILLRSPK